MSPGPLVTFINMHAPVPESLVSIGLQKLLSIKRFHLSN